MKATPDREKDEHDAALLRIAEAIERLDRRFDEFCRSYLNAKFPHGRPIDRWRRGA